MVPVRLGYAQPPARLQGVTAGDQEIQQRVRVHFSEQMLGQQHAWLVVQEMTIPGCVLRRYLRIAAKTRHRRPERQTHARCRRRGDG